MDRDPLTEKVIGCAIEVHRILGTTQLYEAVRHQHSTGLHLNFNVQLLKDGITHFKL